MDHKNKKSFFYNSFMCVKLFFRFDRGRMLIYVFLNIIYAFAWVLQTISLQYVFDSITEKQTIVLPLIVLGSVYMFYHLMDGINNCFPEIMSLRIHKELQKTIFSRINKMNPAEFEDTDRLDYINKAMNASQSMIGVGFTWIDLFTYYLAYFCFMAYYLIALKPSLALSIVIIFIPTILSKLFHVGMFRKLEEKTAPLRREVDYYERCQTDREFFKETRLLGANIYFLNLFVSAQKKLNRLLMQINSKKNLLNIIMNFITSTGYGVIILMLFLAVMKREISLGAFAAVLTSINNLFRFMNKMIIERLGWASENTGMVENYLTFVNEKQYDEDKHELNEKNDIILSNVSFTYPNAVSKALDGINLTIHPDQKIAIVGENGSGKTTLCRIIMGLYEPDKGEARYGNIALSSLKGNGISAVFQKFCKYHMTIKDNIAISYVDSPPDGQKITDICRRNGINVEQNINGIDTMLGPEFGGIDISGGQWQRIAIARGIYRTSDIIILDEPTASIDPLEETRIYGKFSEMASHKTMLLVTHRLGAAKLADRIIVMKNGKVVQDGTNEELSRVEGEYRRLYEAQRKWYV